MRDLHPLPGADHVVDGVRLRVGVLGSPRPDRPAVLLLHGLPTWSYLWRDVMRDLARHALVVAPDLVGCGRSERPTDRGYRLAEQAVLLAGLLDTLDLDRVLVAGQDLGGTLAVHLAALAPQRVAGLALLAAPVHASAWPSPPAATLLAPGVGRLGVRLLDRSLQAGRLTADPLDPRALDAYRAPLRSPGGADALVRLVRSVDAAAAERAWRQVCATAPRGLVLWGEHDRLRPASYGERVAAEFGADWVPVAGAGHLVAEDRPERVAEELAALLGDLSG